VSPKVRVWAAWALVAACLIGWPLSAFTFARNEPQFILALSWIAILVTALDVVSTQDVRSKQEGEGGE
jgi:hypothetical protein